jgi:hypothetical protein
MRPCMRNEMHGDRIKGLVRKKRRQVR